MCRADNLSASSVLGQRLNLRPLYDGVRESHKGLWLNGHSKGARVEKSIQHAQRHILWSCACTKTPKTRPQFNSLPSGCEQLGWGSICTLVDHKLITQIITKGDEGLHIDLQGGFTSARWSVRGRELQMTQRGLWPKSLHEHLWNYRQITRLLTGTLLKSTSLNSLP